jgi:hypothetical protein
MYGSLNAVKPPLYLAGRRPHPPPLPAAIGWSPGQPGWPVNAVFIGAVAAQMRYRAAGLAMA